MPQCNNRGCNATFKWRHELKRHKDRDFQYPPQQNTLCRKNTDETFTCNTCASTFKHQSGVIKHLNNKVCTREKQVSEFKCTHCPAVFPYKSRLDSHLKAHLPPKKCPSCLREFKRKDFFEKHIASCVEDPNFVPSFSVNDQCPESVMTEEETVPAAELHSEIHATPPHVETTKDIVILIPVSIWNRVLSFRCQRRRL